LSPDSVRSQWVEEEWQSKYHSQIESGEILVIPILYRKCEIPYFIKGKFHADFSSSFEKGLIELDRALNRKHKLSGIDTYYSDFVDIGDDWEDFFRTTESLSLLMMYSATWRNTYLQHIARIAYQGEVSIVLPNPNNAKLLANYEVNTGIPQIELKSRCEQAITDYLNISKKITIYTIDQYITHAMYLGNHKGFLALYSYCPGRIPTPAFHLVEGSLFNYCMNDFLWTISSDNTACNRVI